MADVKEVFLEAIKDEAFLKALVTAKTPEDGCALLLEKGLKMEPENFKKMISCIDDSLPDDQVEAVAGGLGNITNENLNIGGAQGNFSYNDTYYKLVDNSTWICGTLIVADVGGSKGFIL